METALAFRGLLFRELVQQYDISVLQVYSRLFAAMPLFHVKKSLLSVDCRQ